MNISNNLVNIIGILTILTSLVYFLFISQKAIKKRKKLKENMIQEKDYDDFLILENSLVNNENSRFRENHLQSFQSKKEKLIQIMREEKPYLDQEITLVKLAKYLNIDPILLSHILKQEFNQNFIDFINEYRVGEMKQFLQDDSLNITFKALLQNSGFKSKSAVNIAFKESTGMTLSNYMKRIQTLRV